MSSLESVVFGAMWVTVLVMGGLLLLLYRQVDRAYRSISRSMEMLPRGSKVPAIEIINGTEFEPLELSEPNVILLFLDTGCPSCRILLPKVSNYEGIRVVALMSGDGRSQDFRAECEVYWLSHPPDVVQQFGISSFPLAYSVRDAEVALASPVATIKDFESFLAKAGREYSNR